MVSNWKSRTGGQLQHRARHSHMATDNVAHTEHEGAPRHRPAAGAPPSGDRRRRRLLSMCVATEFKSNAKEIKKRLAWRREYIQFRYFVWPYRNDRTTVPLTSILLSWVWTRTTKQISSNVVPCSNISLNQPAGWPWSSRRTGDVAGGWGQWERAASYATRRHSPHGTTTTKKL